MGNTLFKRLVEVSGLSAVFAEGVLSRALERAGVSAETLSRFQIPRAREELQRTLLTYLTPGEAAERLEAIGHLARSPSATLSTR